VAYAYELMREDGHTIVAYHWHPHGVSHVTVPHFHLGHASGVTRPELIAAHLPTGRVSLEQFIRFLLEDFEIRPNKSDWRGILERTQAAFEHHRSWS
jgi:hypothetical protein